jgi:magnesium transporter
VQLAVLMPVIAALGGNAGVQTLAVVIRALAVRELTQSNALKVLAKELAVGVLNSTVLTLIGGSVALAWFGRPDLALVFGAAVIITVCAAALIGAAVPLLLDRFQVDPATASSVFVTPTIDAIGFCAFLGLATLYLL